MTLSCYFSVIFDVSDAAKISRNKCVLVLINLSTLLINYNGAPCSLFGSHMNLSICVSSSNALLSLMGCILYVSCSGPREDATRIGSAGVVRRQAVDISPLRRVNQAIYLLTTGARESAFRNIKTIAECLADELINAAKGSSNRYICCFIPVFF